jgi:hypothetical protein
MQEVGQPSVESGMVSRLQLQELGRTLPDRVMRNRVRALAIVVCIIACVSLLVWDLSCNVSPAPHEDAASRNAKHGIVAAETSSVATSPGPSRQSDASIYATLMIKETSGEPIVGAIAEPLADTATVDSDLDNKSAVWWAAASNGECRVPEPWTAARIAIRANGFMPRTMRVVPGETYDVVLTPVVRTTINVVNQDGRPVASFGVAVACNVSNRSALQDGTSKQSAGMYRFIADGVVSAAETDRNGKAVLYLPPGLHHPIWNTTRMMIGLQKDKNSVAILAGQEHNLVVVEPLACVVRLQGDNIVCHTLVPSGVSFAGNQTNALVRNMILTDLTNMFPGCVVSCEMPDSRGDPHARVYTIGTYSGVTVHRVPYVRASELTSPLIIDVATTSSVQLGSVVISVKNPDGKELRMRDGELRFRTKCAGKAIVFPCSGSKTLELPLGEIEIMGGLSGLPLALVPTAKAIIRRGETAFVNIDLPRPMFRGRLVFRTKSGGEPIGGSVDYGLPDAMRTRIMVTDTVIDGWFEVGTEYVGNFSGARAAGRIDIETKADPNEVQTWNVTLDVK